MKLAIASAVLFLGITWHTQVKPNTEVAQTNAAEPSKPKTWMIIGLSNVSKDPDQNYGHGEGDSLTVIIRGNVVVGGLSELEGSQQDPSPICVTGTFRSGFLRLRNHPSDARDQITIRGKLYSILHGHEFHGRITGGPFHTDAKDFDSHFPPIVTLRALHDEYDSDQAADELSTGTCACEWKKQLGSESFVTAPCPPTEK